MGQQLVGNDLTLPAQYLDSSPKIDGVPEDDGGDDEVETAGAVLLAFVDSVTDTAETMKENRAREGVVGLSLIQFASGLPTQHRIFKPIECK